MAKDTSTKTMKLTKSAVNGLPTISKGQTFIWDSELKGFGIRITPGNISYICQGRVKGETVRYKIGRHGVYHPDTARKEARKHLLDMSNGIDPRNKKKEEQAASLTLADVTDEYLKDRDLKDSTIWTVRKHIDGTLKSWKNRPISEITRDDVLKKFRSMEGTPTQANQAFRHLRAILNYARATHRIGNKPILPENPVDVIKDAKIWNPAGARNGRIPTDKVGMAWAFIQDQRPIQIKSATTAAYDLITFLLFTGARIGEARNLTWGQIDLDAGTWFLPDPKNREPIKRPLSTPVLKMLKNRKKAGTLVFSGMGKNQPLKDIRHTLNNIASIVGVPLSPHDLRRTFTGIANAANVEFWKVKLLMGHTVKNDVTLQNYADTTDLSYLQPDIEAIGAWVERQADIARAGNVVDIQTRKAAK
jgi:integrase